MEYLIGVILALVVCVFAMITGFDRDRAFYPMLLAVIAGYYILFAVMSSSTAALLWECVIAAGFFCVAVTGFKKSLWLIVAALVGHGIFDCFHHRIVHNPGVPAWWPGFCLSFDAVAGLFLAMRLLRRSAITY
jgi:hypothetical protein